MMFATALDDLGCCNLDFFRYEATDVFSAVISRIFIDFMCAQDSLYGWYTTAFVAGCN